MNPIKSEDELREQVEKCFIDNNMCDCGEAHTKLSLDETEFFDVEKVVTDITQLITNLQRQHERELVEARTQGKISVWQELLDIEPHYLNEDGDILVTPSVAKREIDQLSNNQEGEK